MTELRAVPESLPELPPRIDPFDRFLALLEIGLVAVAGSVAALLLLAAFGVRGADLTRDASWLSVFMIIETSLTLLLVFGLLKARGQHVGLLGFSTPLSPNLLAGMACVPLLFVLTAIVAVVFRSLAPSWVTTENPLLTLIQTREDLLLLVVASLYTGGFKEEVQRAFALERFRSHLGGVWPGLFLWSIFFGIGHTFQGLDNAVGAGLLGVAFGLLYLWRKSLWAPAGAHALFNVATILIYWTAVGRAP